VTGGPENSDQDRDEWDLSNIDAALIRKIESFETALAPVFAVAERTMQRLRAAGMTESDASAVAAQMVGVMLDAASTAAAKGKR
jgi:hypothetical protein